MISLVEWLCDFLECHLGNLEDRCVRDRAQVVNALSGLPMYTSHNDHRNPIKYDGLTKAGPRNIFAYGGQLGITLEQVYYEHCGTFFQYPLLPCVVRKHADIIGETYYPLELILVDPEPNSWRALLLCVKLHFVSAGKDINAN